MEKEYKLGLLTLLSFLTIVVSACTVSEDINKQTIKSVIETAFTLPDKDLLAEFDDLDNATMIGDVSDSESSPVANGIEEAYQERYGNDFIEYGYQKFKAGIASGYLTLADQSGYQMTVENITVKQDKDNQNRYGFEAEIIYTTNEGEEKKTTLIGRVEFKKEGKIDSLGINDDGGLAQEMTEIFSEE